ncbi:hypothetical protein GALMADRAFT_217428, partial [Galerina marginata CBS 339.88]
FTPRPQAPPPPAETSDTTFNNLRSLIATIMRNRGQNSQDPPQTAHDEADDEDLEVPPLSLAEGTDDGHTTIASSDNGHVANTNTNDNDSDGSMPGLQSVSDTDSGDESDDSTTSRRATRPPKVLAAAADLGDPVWDFGLSPASTTSLDGRIRRSRITTRSSSSNFRTTSASTPASRATSPPSPDSLLTCLESNSEIEKACDVPQAFKKLFRTPVFPNFFGSTATSKSSSSRYVTDGVGNLTNGKATCPNSFIFDVSSLSPFVVLMNSSGNLAMEKVFGPTFSITALMSGKRLTALTPFFIRLRSFILFLSVVSSTTTIVQVTPSESSIFFQRLFGSPMTSETLLGALSNVYPFLTAHWSLRWWIPHLGFELLTSPNIEINSESIFEANPDFKSIKFPALRAVQPTLIDRISKLLNLRNITNSGEYHPAEVT